LSLYHRKAATGSQEEIQQQQQLPCLRGWEEEAADPSAFCSQPEALGETLAIIDNQRSVQRRSFYFLF
jgi:hypothetical protein